MKKYFIEFIGKGKTPNKEYYVKANSLDEASRLGYNYPESSMHYKYSDLLVQEVKEGLKVIGLEVESYDYVFKKTFPAYVFIEANSREEACNYYTKNIKNRHFDGYNTAKLISDGKCVYRNIIKSYYASVAVFDFSVNGITSSEAEVVNKSISDLIKLGNRFSPCKELNLYEDSGVIYLQDSRGIGFAMLNGVVREMQHCPDTSSIDRQKVKQALEKCVIGLSKLPYACKSIYFSINTPNNCYTKVENVIEKGSYDIKSFSV